MRFIHLTTYEQTFAASERAIHVNPDSIASLELVDRHTRVELLSGKALVVRELPEEILNLVGGGDGG